MHFRADITIIAFITLASFFVTFSSAYQPPEYKKFCTKQIGPSPQREESARDGSNTIKDALTIINGIIVHRGAAPWMVSLQSQTYGMLLPYCGGVILDECHVLTAAHCVSNMRISDVLVVAGKQNLTVKEQGEEIRLVRHSTVHPGYDEFSRENDVAVLRLYSKLHETKYVKPIKFLPSPQPYVNEVCSIYGWGSTTERGPGSNILMVSNQSVYDQVRCRQSFEPLNTIKQGMLCAAGYPDASGPCQGDWGGPLVCRGDELSGVASWGTGCANTEYPTVYSNATFFYDWITSATHHKYTDSCDNDYFQL